MTKGRHNIVIALEQFTDFYMKSPLASRRKSVMDEQANAAEGVQLTMPAEGVFAKFWFIVTLPLVLAMYIIPDVRVPGKDRYCFRSFFLSICFIGIFSYFMVKWATSIGDTFRIPDVVMGLTFLAAGTSVPDLLSSVIVAKQVRVSVSDGLRGRVLCTSMLQPFAKSLLLLLRS